MAVAGWSRDVGNDDPRKRTLHHFLKHGPRPKLFSVAPLPALPSRWHSDAWRIHDDTAREGALYTAAGPACATCGYLDSSIARFQFFYGKGLDTAVWSCSNDIVAGNYDVWTDREALAAQHVEFARARSHTAQ